MHIDYNGYASDPCKGNNFELIETSNIDEEARVETAQSYGDPEQYYECGAESDEPEECCGEEMEHIGEEEWGEFVERNSDYVVVKFDENHREHL